MGTADVYVPCSSVGSTAGSWAGYRESNIKLKVIVCVLQCNTSYIYLHHFQETVCFY